MEGTGGGVLKSVANRVKQSELQTEGSRALGTKRGKTQRLRASRRQSLEWDPEVSRIPEWKPKFQRVLGGGPIWSWPDHSLMLLVS